MEYDHETANPPGRSPHVLDIGADTDSTEVTSTLSSHGSSPSAVDRSGKSSLFTARSPRENDVGLQQLFSESCAGKIWRTAAHLIPDKEEIDRFPEYVLSTGSTVGRYTTREAKFWTCGFFPGSLYCLLERCTKFPKLFPVQDQSIDRQQLRDRLLALCRRWSEPLHNMAYRTNTHDIGFIIMPALRQDWELTGNKMSLNSILIAAQSLSSRYDERVGAIRSWDQSFSKRYSITDKEENFLVIVDSMCNLDLLFYAGNHTGNQRYIDIATRHAQAVARAIIRPDNSTFHVCNFYPKTGAIQKQYTHQGFHDNSTWSRGQAWGILGFAQTYMWTKEPYFLSVACSLANFFLKQLSSATHHHPYVPLWDFDDTAAPYLRDTSAGMIAANGMLIIHQAMSTSMEENSSPYLDAVLRIVAETTDLSFANDPAPFVLRRSDENKITIDVEETKFASILQNATANNNEFATLRYSDHGLVYADYYFLELGNKLLRMALV